MVRNYVPVLGAHARRFRHDRSTVEKAVSLIHAGQNNTEISNATGISIRQIGKYRRRIRQYGSIELPPELKGKPGRKPKGSERPKKPKAPKEPRRRPSAPQEHVDTPLSLQKGVALMRKSKATELLQDKMNELRSRWLCRQHNCENNANPCWDWKRTHYTMDERIVKAWAKLILAGKASSDTPTLEIAMALRDKGPTKRTKETGAKITNLRAAVEMDQQAQAMQTSLLNNFAANPFMNDGG